MSVQAKTTAARHTLKDPAEVMAFLGRLVEWGHSPDNAWHTCPSCLGWQLNPNRLEPVPTPLPGMPLPCIAAAMSARQHERQQRDMQT